MSSLCLRFLPLSGLSLEAYERWYDVSDEEVLDLLRERIREKEQKNHQFHELEA